MNVSTILIYVLCFVALGFGWYAMTHLNDVYDKCYAKVVEMCGPVYSGYKNYSIPYNFNVTSLKEMFKNGTENRS